MYISRFCFVLTLFVLLFGAAVHAAWDPFNYRIGPRDILSVTVFSAATSANEEDTVMHKLPVSASGEIAMPLVGKVKASGVTSTQLEVVLLKKLKRYFNAPQVSVAVEQFQSKQVYVLGQVEKNGPIYLTREKTTLAEVISEAGGFINPMTALTEGADSRNIIITRGEKRMIVNLHAQLTNLSSVKNFYIQPGDLVFVPKPIKRFQVLGGAKKAGEFELVEGMTLLRAIALAGSFNEKARRERVYILRTKADGSKHRIHIDCRQITSGRQQDPEIQQNDVIFVAEW